MTMEENYNPSIMDEKWLNRIGIELEHPGMLIVQRLGAGCTLAKLKLEFEALLQAAENCGSELIESSLQHTTPLQKHVQNTSKQLQSVSIRLSKTVNQIKDATNRLEKLERTITRLLDRHNKLSAVKSVISSILFTTRHFIDICVELRDQIQDNDIYSKYNNDSISSRSFIYSSYINESQQSESSRSSISSGKIFNLSNVEYLRVIAMEIGRTRQSVQELKRVCDRFLDNFISQSTLVSDDEVITNAIKHLSESLEILENFSEWSIKTMLEMVKKSLRSRIIKVDNFGKSIVIASSDLDNFLNLLRCYYALTPKKTLPSFLTLFHDIIERCLGNTLALDAGPEEQFNEFQKFGEKILLELKTGSIKRFLDELSSYEGSEAIIYDLASILGNQIFRTIEHHFRYIFAPVYTEPFLKAVETISKLQDSIESLAGPMAIGIWRGSEIPKSVASSLCISPLLQSLSNNIIERMHTKTLNDTINAESDADNLYLGTSQELICGCIEITHTLRFFEYYPLMVRVISDLIQLYTSHLHSFIFWEKEMKECQITGHTAWPQGITPSHAVYLLSDLKTLYKLFGDDGKISNALLSNIDYPKSVLDRVEAMTDKKPQHSIYISEFVQQLTAISQAFLQQAINALNKIYNELVSFNLIQIDYVSDEIFQSCSVTFQFIKALPSQFRLAKCIRPTVPSSFISFILVPLNSFVEFAMSINKQVMEMALGMAIEKVAKDYDRELDEVVEAAIRQNESLKFKFKSEMTITTNIELLKAQVSLDVREFVKLVATIYKNDDGPASFSQQVECLNKWIQSDDGL